MKTFTPHVNSGEAGKRARSGVSPVIASTILIGITVVLGLALWSFANSGVGAATQEYAESVTEYGRFTSDKFTIANIDFNNPNDDDVAFWIFNSGKTATTINNVVLVDRNNCEIWNPGPVTSDPPGPLSVDSKELKKFHFNSGGDLDTPACVGQQTFELTVVSDTGASQTYVKKK